MSAPRTVRIEIERLVVDAAAPVRADLFEAAFVDELARLAGRPPLLWSSSSSAPSFSAAGAMSDVVADPSRDPAGAGRALAAVVLARLIAGAGDG